jgi:hypothetical protein
VWWGSGMEAVPGLAAAIAALRGPSARFDTLTDEQTVDALGRVEDLGRLVDGLRVSAAAEAERRSDARLGEGRLAFRNGARDAVELVQQTARISSREAKRRVAIGSALAPQVSIIGHPLPGRHPAVAEAVQQGRIGLDAAREIVNTAKEAGPRATSEAVRTMVESLIETATAADVETVRDAAALWILAIDPDGAEPRARQQHRHRALRIRRTLLDGTTTATLVLTPQHLARLRELLQSRRRGTGLIRTVPGGDDDPTTDGPEWREEHGPDGGDPRTRAQQDYDTLFAILEAGAKAETVDTSAAVTHQIVVTITAGELERRHGQGWVPGVLAGLPVPSIEQQACDGTMRLLVTGPKGEPLYLSDAHRLFSPDQKLALTVAAGGTCQHPGCTVPHPYLEAHHITWYCRDGGRTHIDNGIMLCSYHHHLVHAQDSPIEIIRHDNGLHVVPKGWAGPPEPRHRCRNGPPGRPGTG